ncbi:MAG: class I SAM-dependent methyltransferase [Bradyrhizobium sp.]
MRFDHLDVLQAYDGVWASACLLHVPKEELSGILARIHHALKPAGVFYASFKAGEGDGRDSLGRYYNYPSADWLKATYEAAGDRRLLALETSEIKSFDETPATMLHLVVRRS